MIKSFRQHLLEAKGLVVSSDKSPLFQKREGPTTPLHDDNAVKSALESDATSKTIMAKGISHKSGDLVGARLNLNVLKNTGVPVLTLHGATNKEGYKKGNGFYGGSAEAYHHVVSLKNAHFNVNQKAREQIATGQASKFPMASVDGHFDDPKNHSFDGVVASFNPKRHHLFVDDEGKAIKSAEHVTLHAHKAYLRGKIEYHTPESAPKRAGDAPTAATLSEETTYEIYFK